MTSVLLVDDEALVRSGVRMMLEAAPGIEVVGEASDGVAALAEVARCAPDVVLLDVQMPVLDGVATARRLLREPAPPRVLMLTTFDVDEYVYEALRAGAAGYLLKSATPEQVVEGVRAAAAGDAVLAPGVTRRLVDRFGGGSRVCTALQGLTERERDVTRLVASGLSNAEIGARLHLETSTVKTHIAHTLAKAGLRNRTQLVVRAYESGLVRPGDEPPG